MTGRQGSGQAGARVGTAAQGRASAGMRPSTARLGGLLGLQRCAQECRLDSEKGLKHE